MRVMQHTNSKDTIMQFVYAKFGELIKQKEFVKFDKVLEELLTIEIRPMAYVPFLTLSRECKDNLKKREELLLKATRELELVLYGEELEKLIKRL